MGNGHQTNPDPSRVADRWMGRTGGRAKTARALRIYEYVDKHGVVYWSFTKVPPHSVRRLNVVDLRGTHFRAHLSDIQRSAYQMELLEGME